MTTFFQVRFRWAVNTSRGLSHLDPSRYRSSGTTSYLVYKPQLTLSKEAEQMRSVYYVNRKRGFYGSESGNNNNVGGNTGKTKSMVESDNLELHRSESRNVRNVHDENVIRFQTGIDGSKRGWYDFSDHIGTNRGGVHNFVSHNRPSEENEMSVSTSQEEFISGQFNQQKKFSSVESDARNDNTEEIQSADDVNESSGDAEGFVGLEETYGVVYCWGENEQGKQQQPCVISVTPAGKLCSFILPAIFC